jgi:hypothetical protein
LCAQTQSRAWRGSPPFGTFVNLVSGVCQQARQAGEVRHCIGQKPLLAVLAIVAERQASNGFAPRADSSPSTRFAGRNERKTLSAERQLTSWRLG